MPDVILNHMDNRQKKSLLEALLFSSVEPVTLSELSSATGFSPAELRELVQELIHEYTERGGGLFIAEVAEGYQMLTNPDYGEWVKKFSGQAKAQRLSVPSLEALAIVAYKQPITKAEVEELRGVNSDGVLKTLLERRLIKILGRKEVAGRPLLYGTTREFLEYFGLRDLTQLPILKDLQREEA